MGLSGLSNGTTYHWQVRARNAAGTTEANGGTWVTVEYNASSNILPEDQIDNPWQAYYQPGTTTEFTPSGLLKISLPSEDPLPDDPDGYMLTRFEPVLAQSETQLFLVQVRAMLSLLPPGPGNDSGALVVGAVGSDGIASAFVLEDLDGTRIVAAGGTDDPTRLDYMAVWDWESSLSTFIRTFKQKNLAPLSTIYTSPRHGNSFYSKK